MDKNLEFIQTVCFALLLINIDDLIGFLFVALQLSFNSLLHFTPSDIKWLFTSTVIVIVVVLILWEFCIYTH